MEQLINDVQLWFPCLVIFIIVLLYFLKKRSKLDEENKYDFFKYIYHIGDLVYSKLDTVLMFVFYLSGFIACGYVFKILYDCVKIFIFNK